MLASTAPTVEAAMEKVGEAAVEWKLDGVRVQVHRAGDEVRVFTRTLDDITARVPEVVAAVLALPVRAAVLDGELIALQPGGRPHPFQVTAGRVGSRLDVERLAASPAPHRVLVRPAPPGRPGPARPGRGRAGHAGPWLAVVPEASADPSGTGHRPTRWSPPGFWATRLPAATRA